MGKQHNPDKIESSIVLKWNIDSVIDKPYNELFSDLAHLEQLLRGYAELDKAILMENVSTVSGRSKVNSVNVYTERSILTDDSVIEKVLRPIARITCQDESELNQAEIHTASSTPEQYSTKDYRLGVVVFYNPNLMPDKLNQEFRKSIQCGVGQLGINYGDILYDRPSGAIEVELSQSSCTVKQYKEMADVIKSSVDEYLSPASPTQQSVLSRVLDGGSSTSKKIIV